MLPTQLGSLPTPPVWTNWARISRTLYANGFIAASSHVGSFPVTPRACRH